MHTVKITQADNGYIVEAADWNNNEITLVAHTLEEALRFASSHFEPKTAMVIHRPESAT